MKLFRNVVKDGYNGQPNLQEISPFNISIDESVWLIEVNDDCILYINGEAVTWATYDSHDYSMVAKALPNIMFNMAEVLKFEPYWLVVELDENDAPDSEWEWDSVVDFITTGKQ